MKTFWPTTKRADAGAGLVDFGDRTQIEIAGDDRARFLHNLCTGEIRKLAPGAGCEALLTNVQGKILAHVLIFSGPDSLVLETVPGQAEKILAHLDRYLIREKVELRRPFARLVRMVAGRSEVGVAARRPFRRTLSAGALVESPGHDRRLRDLAAAGRPGWPRGLFGLLPPHGCRGSRPESGAGGCPARRRRGVRGPAHRGRLPVFWP